MLASRVPRFSSRLHSSPGQVRSKVCAVCRVPVHHLHHLLLCQRIIFHTVFFFFSSFSLSTLSLSLLPRNIICYNKANGSCHSSRSPSSYFPQTRAPRLRVSISTACAFVPFPSSRPCDPLSSINALNATSDWRGQASAPQPIDTSGQTL